MVKNVEKHCKKLEERIQSIQQEFQEQLGEQSRKTDQISVQIEALSNQFQAFLAHHGTGKEMESTSKGILQTPARSNPEGIFSRGKGLARGDANYGQEPQRTMFNTGFPRMDLTTFRGDNPRRWLRRCNKFFKLNDSIAAMGGNNVLVFGREGRNMV
jgi:hypothetical protein